MSELIVITLLFMIFFDACSAEAAEFAGSKKGLPSLVTLSTPTCGHCVQMSRVLDSINEKYGEKIFTEKIDLMSRRDLASEFNVRSVPHLLFVDAEGKVFEQKIGFTQEDDVLKVFENAGIIVR